MSIRLSPFVMSITFYMLFVSSLLSRGVSSLQFRSSYLQSDSMVITTTTRTLLSFGVILELLGILLAICFIQSYHLDEDSRHQAPFRLASGVPIVLF
jgi:hypothetical protein